LAIEIDKFRIRKPKTTNRCSKDSGLILLQVISLY